MRGFPLIPVLETPDEVARFFRRGWFHYYFPRFPIFAVFIWLSGPIAESIRHLSSSFNVRWIDLAWSMLAATIISIPIWFGYKHTYRDLCGAPPENDKPA
jgi:hypothetical protein